MWCANSLGEILGGPSQAQVERRAWVTSPIFGFKAMQIFDTQDLLPFSPLREVHDSGRVWGKKRALLYLEAISHCVFPRVAEIGALSGRSSDRQEKVVVPSTTPTHPPFFS